jgi:hypothetical protein
MEEVRRVKEEEGEEDSKNTQSARDGKHKTMRNNGRRFFKVGWKQEKGIEEPGNQVPGKGQKGHF